MHMWKVSFFIMGVELPQHHLRAETPKKRTHSKEHRTHILRAILTSANGARTRTRARTKLSFSRLFFVVGTVLPELGELCYTATTTVLRGYNILQHDATYDISYFVMIRTISHMTVYI